MGPLHIHVTPLPSSPPSSQILDEIFKIYFNHFIIHVAAQVGLEAFVFPLAYFHMIYSLVLRK